MSLIGKKLPEFKATAFKKLLYLIFSLLIINYF